MELKEINGIAWGRKGGCQRIHCMELKATSSTRRITPNKLWIHCMELKENSMARRRDNQALRESIAWSWKRPLDAIECVRLWLEGIHCMELKEIKIIFKEKEGNMNPLHGVERSIYAHALYPRTLQHESIAWSWKLVILMSGSSTSILSRIHCMELKGWRRLNVPRFRSSLLESIAWSWKFQSF